MFPVIRSGDWVELQLLRGQAALPVPGDIILFSKDKSLYLHRCIGTKAGACLCKGDMSFGADGFIAADSLLGRVVAIRRGQRRIDLRSAPQRLCAACIAASSVFLQYPLAAIRLAARLVLKLFSAVQAVPWYRRIAGALPGAQVRIRVAGESDVEQLRDLYLMASRDVRKGLNGLAGRGAWLAAQQGRRIVAALTVACDEHDPKVWMVFGLEVKPLLRGRGIGRAVMAAALAYAADHGARTVGLFVNRNASAAVALYRSLGFRETTQAPAGYRRGSSELYLSLDVVAGGDVHSRALRWLIAAGGRAGIAQRASAEGMLYPLYPLLCALVPVDQRQALQRLYYAHLAAGEEYRAAIMPVLAALEAAAVPALVFKGPAVDALAYADGYVRPRLDLDIAVRDEHSSGLETALAGLGYVPAQQSCGYPLPEYLNSRVYRDARQTLVPVHVHRGLFNNLFLCADGYLTVSADAVWQQTRVWDGHRHLRTLSPEANLIYICDHALKHDFEQLVFLYEIERLIGRTQQADIDWKKLLYLAREWGLQQPVYCGLSLAQRVLGAAVPQEVIASLEPGDRSWTQKFCRDVAAGRRGRYGCHGVYLAMRKGLPAKLRFVLRMLLPRGFGLRGALLRAARCKTLFCMQLKGEKSC